MAVVTLADSSIAAPAMVNCVVNTIPQRDRVIAWTGTDGAGFPSPGSLNVMDLDLVIAGQAPAAVKQTLTESSRFSPALAAHNGRVYIAWTGTDGFFGAGHLNVMSSTFGRDFDPATKVTLPETSSAGPAIISFQGFLIIAWRGIGGDNLNVMMSSDGTSFTNKVTLPLLSLGAPAVATNQQQAPGDPALYLCFADYNDFGLYQTRCYNAIVNGNIVPSFGFGGAFPLADGNFINSSDSGPSLVQSGGDGNIVIAWAGRGNQAINFVGYDSDNIHWNRANQKISRESSIGAPAMALGSGGLLFCWTGTDGTGRLNYAFEWEL